MNFTTSFLLAFSIITMAIPGTLQAQETNLSVVEFEKTITGKEVQILDVRTPAEFQTGHIRNALLADWNNPDEFRDRIQSLDKNIPVYTYCLSGGRSAAATRWLNENGFKAANLTGGITAWKKSGKPLEMVQVVKQEALSEYRSKIPKSGIVLVDFSAAWCPPCRKMTPVVDSLANLYRSRFSLVKVDGGTQFDLVKALHVEAFPTFIIYNNGKEVWRKEGVVDARELLGHLVKD